MWEFKYEKFWCKFWCTEAQRTTLQNYVDKVVSGSSLTLNANTLNFASIGGVQKLTANTQMVSYASADENVVTVDKDGTVRAIGEGTTTITAVMGSQTQTINVSVGGNTGKKVTKFIRTVDDFYSLMNATSGYYVLENDIYLGSYKPGDVMYEKDYSYYEYHPTVSFGGTLDGNGYTIHYTHVGRHSVYLFQTLTDTAIVKNCNINVSYYKGTTNYVRAAALAYENKGTIENVYVNVLTATPGQGHGSSVYEKFAKAGLVIVNSGIIKNTVVNMTYTGSDIEHLNGICTVNKGTLENTALIRNNTEIPLLNNGTPGSNVKMYESVDAFASGYDSFVNSGFSGTNYPLVKTALSDVEYEYFAGEATDLTISGISGTVASVKLGGEEVAYTDNSGSVTVSADIMEGKNGKNEFVITTDTSIYTVTANVLKKNKIATAAEFKAIPSGTTEYYVLTSDINLGQYNLGNSVIFAGVLDGDGHTMTYSYGNSHDRALFGTISGTVKNLIVNVTHYDGDKVRSAALAQTNSGTIENVYVNVTANQPGQGPNATYGKAGMVMTNGGVINNSVVLMHYTGTASLLTTGNDPKPNLYAVAVANTGTVTNTAVITVVDNASAGTIPTGVTGTNVVEYTSVAAFAEDFENFKSAGYTGTLYPTVALPTVELSDVEYEYFVGEATDLTISGISGTVASVKLGGEEVAYTDNSGSVTVSASVMEGRNGKNEFVITTDTSIYTVTANVLKKNKIGTAAEFKAIPSGTTEYYVLTSDINFGRYNDGNKVTFAGVLDGDGHTMTYDYGWAHDLVLFDTIGGTVKNLIVNVVFYDCNVARNAALAKTNSGTIENVYVNVTANHPGQGTDAQLSKAGMVMTNSGVINNSVVLMHYTGTVAIEGKLIAVAAANTGTVTNTAVITVVDNASAGTIPTGVTGTNVVAYTSVAAFAEDFENFKSAGYTGTNYPKVTLIRTVEDFVAIENDMTGYYVLANDLSIYSGGGTSANLRFNKPLGFVQSSVNSGTNVPFTGTLDGNGYTLTYNYSWSNDDNKNSNKSLFYIIGATGVVKNLCLNVTEGVSGKTARTAALAWINNGTIENVYTKISFSHNASGQNEGWGAAGLVVSNYGTINNCIVDYTHSLTSGTMPAAVVAMNNAGGNITNTAAIVTCGTTINYQNVNNGTKTNTPMYTSYGDFYAAKDSFISSGFVVGNFWTIGESGITFGN